MTTKEQILNLLRETFQLDHLEIKDDSHKHAGHAGAREHGGGHFSILIVSDDFKGKTLVQRHRMIYKSLDQIKEKIHALAIQAKTIQEYMV